MLADRLDEMNRKKNIHSNLVKWWDINMVSSEDSEDAEDIGESEETECLEDAFLEESSSEDFNFENMDSSSKDMVTNILDENYKGNVFDVVSEKLKEEEDIEKKRKEAEANEIYERLMREAAEDEAKKQAEIEQAKLDASSNC